MELNQQKLNEFLGRAVVDIGATLHAGLVVLGEKLGLYKALTQSGPLTPAEPAKKSGTNERYVRESARSAGIPFDRCWPAALFAREVSAASY